jgi:glycosyltransferase involved in cell wall biosynthesis
MKKIFVRGPVLSATGYGEQSRFALRALRSRPDLFDVYIQPIPWGKSGWIWQDNELRQWMDEKIKTTQLLLSEKVLAPDISLQITIPNEFEKMCPINIGYTAGIETTKVSAKWLQKGNEMDKILVVSNHGKDTYVNTKIPLNDGREYKLNTPVDVVWECTPNPDEAESIEGFNPRHDFNFLVVSQFGPRKNFANTITWFVEKFQNEDVGLILKTHNKGASIIDLDNVEKSLAAVLEPFPNRKCSVSLLHGDLSEAQMKGLYEHDKVKCLINIAHGEGFGLPLFEAARAGLPIATIPWSGQLDFLQWDGKNLFNAIDCTLKPVSQEAVWDGVIQRDSQWAYADKDAYQACLRHIVENYEDCLEGASELQGKVLEHFNAQRLYKLFCDSVMGKSLETPKPVESISFCISTNGAKPEKTNLEIQSIKNTMKEADIPFEIIIAGDTTNFTDIDGVRLVDAADDAHNGRLAKLRNIAGAEVTSDTIVFADDDFIFPKNWAKRLIQYSNTTGWQVTANKILLPDGGRFWDRATVSPHKLVDYDHPQYHNQLYQTGGFWIMRTELFKEHQWDASIVINAEKTGGVNEDVEMSQRMHANNITLSFDKDNTVWHNDNTYKEYSSLTLKVDIIAKHLGVSPEVLIDEACSDFSSELEALSE